MSFSDKVKRFNQIYKDFFYYTPLMIVAPALLVVYERIKARASGFRFALVWLYLWLLYVCLLSLRLHIDYALLYVSHYCVGVLCGVCIFFLLILFIFTIEHSNIEMK